MAADLILGVLHALPVPAIRPFLQSFRRTGSQARVHFFVTGISAADRAKIHEYGATTEAFPYFAIRRNPPLLYLWPLWRQCFARLKTFEARSRLASKVMHLFGIRWVLYHRYLQARPGQFRRVLVTDVRDVLFQSDPFSLDFPEGLHCYFEAAGHTIGRCPNNQRMLRAPFGSEVVEAMKDVPVSCAGTTFGDPDSLLRYCELMVDFLAKGRRFNEDQGVHNFLLHHRLVPGVHLHENGAHAVRTLGMEREAEIPRNGEGAVLGMAGEIVPVLHQYDRHPSLCAELLARFGG